MTPLNHVFNKIIHIILIYNVIMYFTHGLVQMQSADKVEKHGKWI